MAKRRNVCTIHRYIQDQVLILRSMNVKSMTIRELSELQGDILIACNSIDTLIDEANSGAQAMENRLSEYKDTIEELGFKRTKK